MKFTSIIYAVVSLLILSVGTGCKEKKQFKIGVSQCSQDDWRSKMNDEIQREIMFHPEATVEIRSADDSNEKQIADIEYFRDNNFDIIIAAPNEADAITPIIKEVYEAGVPVIVFDRNINGDTYTAQLGVDNFGIGEAAARYAANLLKTGGKVLEIYGLKGSTPAIDRHNGFGREAPRLGLDVVAVGYGNWNGNDAARVADSLLEAHPDVDLIYAHNDRMAIAASEVARKRGMKLKVIGVDAAPEIGIKAVADSVIDATFLYPTEGYRLIRTALAIVKGEPYKKMELMPFASAVDKSNADILLLQNESLKEETSKIQLLKTQVNDYWQRHSAQTGLLYATVAILVLFVIVIFLLLRSFWQHKRYQNELLEQNKLLEKQRDTEKELNGRLNEMTQSKLMFFTNVSHDLRTPLTLISEPVEQLAASENLTPQQHTLLKIAGKNVRILHRLINQILDFRKYENGKLDLNLREVNVGTLIADWAESFIAVARKRHIKLTGSIDLPDNFTMAIDPERVERVFFNLISNAIKYTPDNGRIHYNCSVEADTFVLKVSDTGQGIAAEDLGNIFNRFYQVEKIHPKGSGIGLSLAKAFVELHGGALEVVSELGRGSIFTMKLPVRHTNQPVSTSEVPTITARDVEQELGEVEAPAPSPATADADERPLALIIDDNDDIRCLVKEILGTDYRIIEASNGQSGIRMATKYVPDIIVCDVMMPVMDGLECCRLIKEEVTTSHIPVLMLTACSMDEQRMQGYESGADGYLPKPFNGKLLKLRCKNLIENRKRIKNLWKEDVRTLPASSGDEAPAPVAADLDSEFYNRFLEIARREMGNAEITVDELAAKMRLGRSQFYRKLKALTNYSPVELLRNLRLKQSRELLVGTEKSISEIAYEVGFSAPAYFTRCYRDFYGETPSEVRSRLGR
ncbi:MAG: substrate-binding domain-containing protein [Firmicutes bacterium]|nr:substrate-binding domain-containing protein [Bacillota bacterium]MCM1400600.1 substrate-binding domain-containing protein [Bacteroides sp.]MCM1476311.1 substrate-binding domain-containing protein [Bacteroides sp.]